MSLKYNKLLVFNYLYLILLSLLAAGIYLVYRDSSILINQFFLSLELENIFARKQIQELLPLPHWVIYSLPGAIWVYITTILAVKFEKTERKYTIANYPILFSVGLELFQLFHFTDGTFDWVDLILILIAGYFAKRSNLEEFPLNKYPRFLNLAIISAFLVLFLSDVHH
jgi:hypothetical protein